MKLLALFGFSAVIAVLACWPAGAVSFCKALAPSADPDQNRKNIVDCLAAPEGVAHLLSGVFPVNNKITMPQRTTLSGSPGTVIKAVAGRTGFKANSIVELTGQDVVNDLALVGDGRLQSGCCTTVVAITGSGSRI